ncbi:hypothetical protein EZV62_002366 [Acer yangbiense]|uniref:methionine adenosyltransferase n=1 Tax=Acer yangbiense TaxID=1000413 RepID=A0A5C7IWX7_9ROSI|nr:hypothetical protein EZV62_002366 [Acer yangbiense]
MVPIRVHTILISTQHDETVTNEQIAQDLKEHVIKPVIPAQYLDDKTIFHLNPSGRFVIGGPHGDVGLTGRKIIIDTYGGWGAHGGGAFSGKDPTKVSYAIGVPEPLFVFVDTYKTRKIPDKDILVLIKENFDFRPGMIAINLDLKRGGNLRYLKTAAYVHFGWDDPDFTWETLLIKKKSMRKMWQPKLRFSKKHSGLWICPRGPVRMACQEAWAGSGPVRGGGVANQVRHGGVPRSGLQDDGPPDRPATARGSGGSQEAD